jgi:hypothetical protein
MVKVNQKILEAKRNKRELTFDLKKQICKYHCEQTKINKKFTHDMLITHFESIVGYKIPKTTISDILKSKAKFDQFEEDAIYRYRDRKAQNPELEECLYSWFVMKANKNMPISDEMLIEKAKVFGAYFQMDRPSTFSYSNGWLHKFKLRHNIKQFKISGESASLNLVDINAFKYIHTFKFI